MKACGIPDNLIPMVKFMCNECSVIDERELARSFKIIMGIKQDCVMTGLLFLLAVDWVVCEKQKGRVETASDVTI